MSSFPLEQSDLSLEILDFLSQELDEIFEILSLFVKFILL
jgi:hypothetical protein